MCSPTKATYTILGEAIFLDQYCAVRTALLAPMVRSPSRGERRSMSEPFQENSDPAEASLSELIQCCREERAKFRSGLANNPAYCLEIFKRALQKPQTEASDEWQALIDAFSDWVSGCFYQLASLRAEALARNEPHAYIDGAFSRLFLRNQSQKPLVFTTLGQALSYLRRCLITEVLEGINGPPPSPPPEEERPEPDPITVILDGMAAQDIWRMVLKCTKSKRERRLAHLLWIERYPPRRIVEELPREFPEVNEVYQMRANIAARFVRQAKALFQRLGQEGVEAYPALYERIFRKMRKILPRNQDLEHLS